MHVLNKINNKQRNSKYDFNSLNVVSSVDEKGRR